MTIPSRSPRLPMGEELGVALLRDAPQSEFLEALAARLEREPEGHNLLDARIVEAIGGTLRNYTTSIDAAVTLVPEGYVWAADNLSGNRGYVVGPENDYGNVPVGSSDVPAKTVTLALCAAALRARAALAKQSETAETRGKANPNPTTPEKAK